MSVSSCNRAEATPISLVHSDIIQTHILPRLDGPDLASTSCASSELHSISTQEKLWKDIAIKTWPSINHPGIQHIISTFASGHRSFFSDAFPFPISHEQRPISTTTQINHRDSSNMISAIDIKYDDKVVYSRVHNTGLVTGWLDCVPFRVSLIDPKESVSTTFIPIFTADNADLTKSELEKNLKLSWVLIDPSSKRAVNLSSLRPVSIQRHWITGDIQVTYATILFSADADADCTELVQCGIMVTCSHKEGENMCVKEVMMQMEDTDGRVMNGDENLVILRGALESERGKRREETKNYEHYIDIKIERIEKRRGRDFDILGICIGVTLLITTSLLAFFF